MGKVEKEKRKYKEISKGVEAFVTREASSVADIKRVSKDLELAKESHATFISKTNNDILCFREELQTVKADQYTHSLWTWIRHGFLINWRRSIKKGEIKFFDIIRNFYPEWNMLMKRILGTLFLSRIIR